MRNKIEIEICVNADDAELMSRSVRAAFAGGADRIELCARLDVHGLTPSTEHLYAASAMFPGRALLAMIRPRAGDFNYTNRELDDMCRSIEQASMSGAAGVVFGVLRRGRLDLPAMQRLMGAAGGFGLAVTFHRAFDALENSLSAIDDLVDLGVRRILTAGMPWGASAALPERTAYLQKIAERAGDAVEVVIGGDVNEKNVVELVRDLTAGACRISVHAYSSVLHGSAADAHLVKGLVSAVRAIDGVAG